MKIKLSRSFTALAFVTLLQFSGYAFAQNESVFDVVERANGEPARSLANPAAETAPRLTPRMPMVPRVSPETVIQNPQITVVPDMGGPVINGSELRTAPQAIVADPYAREVDGFVEGVVGAEACVDPHVMPVLPTTCEFSPKLGFHGRLIAGVGMQIVSVNYGGVAHREGLETGDIIVEINGRRIVQEYDYERALVDAAVYGHGHVNLLVKNVRYRPGCSVNPPLVQVNSQLPLRHVHTHPYGVVAAR